MKRRVTQSCLKGRPFFKQIGNRLVFSSSFYAKEALDDTSSSQGEVLTFNVDTILCEISKFKRGEKFMRTRLLNKLDELLC